MIKIERLNELANRMTPHRAAFEAMGFRFRRIEVVSTFHLVSLMLGAMFECVCGKVEVLQQILSPPEELPLPSMIQVVASSFNIMQVRITRSHMAGEPPDVIVAPRLGHFDLLDFHRAGEAIEEGRRAVEACLPSLRLLGIQATETR